MGWHALQGTYYSFLKHASCHFEHLKLVPKSLDHCSVQKEQSIWLSEAKQQN